MAMVEQKYIDYWKACQAKHAAEVKVWEQEAWAQARAAIALLREQFGVTKAIVFGSLVKDRFDEDSDIDIAVEGLATADYFPALTAVNSEGKRWIDLKPWEDLEPRFKERVLATGKAIDENP